MNTFRQDVELVIARHSKGHSLDTPDAALAQYLCDCLAAYDRARRGWQPARVNGTGTRAPDTVTAASDR